MKYQNDPPFHEQKILLSKLKKFNLLWVNPACVAPLEPVEMEILLGFEEEHTRDSSSMIERYKALGNCFQVDTVAYHLSALRGMYCDMIKVLSLFSGIGGAEVALHKAGISLKLVVSVKGNCNRRDVLESWWKRTGQRGRLSIVGLLDSKISTNWIPVSKGLREEEKSKESELQGLAKPRLRCYFRRWHCSITTCRLSNQWGPHAMADEGKLCDSSVLRLHPFIHGQVPMKGRTC
ncbi:hypothetical protein L7F22_064794 [Adiantum nelumboides]|nr:hypothetical protein [Adiantum nelumboides]